MIFGLVETIFFHFLRPLSTDANGRSFSFNQNLFLANRSFRLVETKFLFAGMQHCFIPRFFCQWNLLLDFGKVNFHRRTLLVDTNFFQLFQFFKVEAAFSYNEYCLPLFTIHPTGGNRFSVQSKKQNYFSASRNNYWTQGNIVFKGRANIC